MANPYKNIKKSPLHQDGGKWMTTMYDSNRQNLSSSEKKAFKQGQTDALSFATTFIPIGGAVGAAVKYGGRAANFLKKTWNYGKKGGFGYNAPIPTGKSKSLFTTRKWGDKQHVFKVPQPLTVTKGDKQLAYQAGRLQRNLGKLGRGTAYGGVAVYGLNELSEHNLRARNEIQQDNTHVEPRYHNKVNKTFVTKPVDED
jgi:hypothetical protein